MNVLSHVTSSFLSGLKSAGKVPCSSLSRLCTILRQGHCQPSEAANGLDIQGSVVLPWILASICPSKDTESGFLPSSECSPKKDLAQVSCLVVPSSFVALGDHLVGIFHDLLHVLEHAVQHAATARAMVFLAEAVAGHSDIEDVVQGWVDRGRRGRKKIDCRSAANVTTERHDRLLEVGMSMLPLRDERSLWSIKTTRKADCLAVPRASVTTGDQHASLAHRSALEARALESLHAQPSSLQRQTGPGRSDGVLQVNPEGRFGEEDPDELQRCRGR